MALDETTKPLYPSVERVRAALAPYGAENRIILLGDSARTAAEAAAGLGCPVGAIVKSLVFEHAGRAVMALVAGDRMCDTAALGRALGLGQPPRRASAELVREATGFAIGGVSPFGHPGRLPMAVDASLARFELLHAAAGHPNAVFPLTYQELLAWTEGKPANDLAPER
ncbi:YbaK/EbsC family protein [Ferrovibrio sp.]|uniref:YbaK/EbsC family protein n=1 Tax=Ferrovibrio sp. TaxID=1917215 RepID=UPI001B4EC3E1|nr:YbaK/EbsC family protein [Ferrovibrio sp.]MBP7066296.1 YbaK/EbsC family protein [Ferrovibrio sp.]